MVLCWYSAKQAGVKRACPNNGMAHMRFMHESAWCTLRSCVLVDWYSGWVYIAVHDSHGFSMSLVCSWNEVGMSYVEFPEAPFLGEGKWGRKKCRRIPKREGDWQGRVPKCFPPQKTSKQGIWSSQFLRDRSQVVLPTLRDTPVPLYTRTSPWPTFARAPFGESQVWTLRFASLCQGLGSHLLGAGPEFLDFL